MSPIETFILASYFFVLLILAVLLSFVTPRLLALGQVRRETAALRLATLLGYLHDEASLRGRTYRLTLDFDDASYEVRAMAESDQQGEGVDFVEEWGPLACDESLPAGVRIAEIETPPALASSGTVDLFFHPESDAPGARITLVDDGDGASVLVFDGRFHHDGRSAPGHVESKGLERVCRESRLGARDVEPSTPGSATSASAAVSTAPATSAFGRTGRER